MKSIFVVIGGLLAMLLPAGCQLADSMGARPHPVVALASIADAKTGMTKDLSPTTPFTLPEYPASLFRAGIEGFVDVRLGIRPDGSVSTVGVLTSTDTAFKNPTVAAVKTWQFPQLRREQADAGRDVELVCRLRFSIQRYWHESEGGVPGRPSAP